MLARTTCLFFLATAGALYFLFSLFQNYLAFITHHDTGIYSDLPFFIILSSFWIGSFVQLVRGVISPKMRKWRLICATATMICLAASFHYRDDLIFLGDRAFFALNEGRFRAAIEIETGASVLFQRSNDNFMKLFVYSGSANLGNGLISQPALEAAMGNRVGGFSGCPVISKPLGTQFYVLSVYCGG